MRDKSEARLRLFFFILLRDHMPVGACYEIVTEHLNKAGGLADPLYANESAYHLGQLSDDVLDRIRQGGETA